MLSKIGKQQTIMLKMMSVRILQFTAFKRWNIFRFGNARWLVLHITG